MISEYDRAERLVRLRARWSGGMGWALITTLTISFGGLGGASGTPHTPWLVTAGWIGWAAWMVLIGVCIATGGVWRVSPAMRALMNDETSLSHRRCSLAGGFWVAMIVSAMVYAASFALDLSVREALRIVVTSALSSALISFAEREERALKNG